MDRLHLEANVAKFEPRRICHLVNFVYARARDPRYIRINERNLHNFNVPVLNEIFPNNATFSLSVLFLGAVYWNALPVANEIFQILRIDTWGSSVILGIPVFIRLLICIHQLKSKFLFS